MSAREAILQRVRQGVAKGDFAARRAAAEATLTAAVRGPQPVLPADHVARFVARAESLASTVDFARDEAAALMVLVRWLDENQLGRQAVVATELAALPWVEHGFEIAARPAVDADRVGITGCFCAIAETGTLMLLSSPQTPASVSLLPETHVAFVSRARIVATMEDAFALLLAEQGTVPRAINFISGPSRTGDIEQTIVLGAHGPCRVHLILIGDEA